MADYEIFFLNDPETCGHENVTNEETRLDHVDTAFCLDCEVPVERDETQPEWHL